MEANAFMSAFIILALAAIVCRSLLALDEDPQILINAAAAVCVAFSVIGVTVLLCALYM